MKTWVALFRGINVGGRNLLPMKELVSIMEDCGHSDIKTYIQSGNVVFDGDSVSASEIAKQVEQQKGFCPEVLILESPEFELALKKNPFKTAEGKACHFFFSLEHPGSVDEERLNQLKSATEEFVLEDKVFYLHAPEGIGRSKLASNVERCLGVPGTGRNLNTVNKLAEILSSRS